ncbi:NB-ARC domain-containing protein [Actinoplanes lutulentus]|uniref:NB-ARC domain-containing protein n=1 Tax=Actinoplanes lutulentus TaxID=1287878 RepID=A0A327ZMF5_9ACTN|nr:NB-ARC domain-containing protein [Actinoplanes lutulentus]RAK42194.1 NB-ARC domain-containing protein [Actinoplanes lutulentus]
MGTERGFPCPDEAADLAGFVRALRDVKVWGGNPSLEVLRRRTGVAASTLSDAFSVNRRRLPSLDLVRAVVLACGGDQYAIGRWEQSWRTLAERLHTAPAAPPNPDPAPQPAQPQDWTPRQLPPDVAGFSGRHEAMDVLTAIPGQAPATLITGTAGVGKTALALHWAHRIAGRYPDGQLYLDLRGHSGDPTIPPVEALSLLLQSLGVQAERIPADLSLQTGLYRSILAGRRVLVVLDNVVDTTHVRPLLPSGAGCHALITSRDALTGLVVREGAARVTLETLEATESVDLLATHLGTTRVAAEPEATAELAALCAHLPLALRIAAANLAARPRHTIAATVRELRGTDLLGRLQVVGDPESAVAAAFDISYRALPAEAQRLFRLLGLLPGPEASREAAAVLLGRDLDDPVPELDELVAAHLLAEPTPDRYRSHDLLSLYARRRAAGDPDTVREQALHRLVSWYLLSADAACETLAPGRSSRDRGELSPTGSPHRFTGPEEAGVWLDTELANLTAAVNHVADHGPRPFAWHLVHSLGVYFYTRSRSGVIHLSMARAALRAARAAEDPDGQGLCHMALGMANENLHDPAAAADEFAAAMEQFRLAGRTRGVTAASANLGDAYIRTGDITRALRLLQENRAGEEIRTAVDAVNLDNLATVQRIRGDHAEALRLDAACHAFGARTGDPLLVMTAEVSMAMTHLERGDTAAAERLLLSAQSAAEEVGSEAHLYDVLAGLTLLCARARRHPQAVRWAAALTALLDRGLTSYSGEDWAHVAIVESHLAAGRPEQALAIGVPALEAHERTGYRLLEMRLRHLLGQAHLTLGDTAAARTLLSAALLYATEQDLPDRTRIETLLETAAPDPRDT